MTGTAIVVVYGTLCVAVIAGRRTGSTAHAAYRMPFYPWPPILALLVLAYVIYTNIIDAKTGQAEPDRQRARHRRLRAVLPAGAAPPRRLGAQGTDPLTP